MVEEKGENRRGLTVLPGLEPRSTAASEGSASGLLLDRASMLASVVDNLPEAIRVVDQDHRIVFANQLAHGGERATLGETAESELPPAAATLLHERIDAVFASGLPTAFESLVETPLGERWLVTRIAPVPGSDGNRACTIVSTDITERKQAELLAQHEQAFSHALSTIHAAIAAPRDADDMIREVLEATLRVLGCDRAWLITPCDPGADSFVFAHERHTPGWPLPPPSQPVVLTPPMADHMARALARAGALRRDPECDPISSLDPLRESLGVQSMLSLVLRPQGSEPWLFGVHHCRRARVYTEHVPFFETLGNRLAEALTAATAQHALRQSEERFRTLFEHAPEAIVMVDADTCLFADVNDNAVHLFGAPREKMLLLGPEDVSPPTQPDGTPSRARARALIARAMNGEAPTFEWTHRTLAGEDVPCEVRLVRLPHGERRLVRGSVTSIAARKASEKAQEQLRQDLAQAQRLQAIGQLTGGVAHDFNNLLTVVSGSLSMIEISLNDREAALRYVAQGQEATSRAAELTRRLLAFARRQPLQPRAVDLNQLVNDAEPLLTRALGETVVVDIRTTEGLWTCTVDPRQLENALLNLAINARDAMPGGGHLTIETANLHVDADSHAADAAQSGDRVVLRVSDEGHGMSEEVRAQVFEPFFTTKAVGKGSGLGLSMVYGFVKQSGGHLDLRSAPGKGTTVELSFPRSDCAADVDDRKSVRESEPRGKGQRVLLLEDEALVRGLVEDLLEALGYRPLSVSTAEEALEALHAHPETALMLSDVVLAEGVRGTEVAARARKLIASLPVVFMSGYARSGVGEYDDLQGEHLLEKPFSKAALARTLRAALGET